MPGLSADALRRRRDDIVDAMTRASDADEVLTQVSERLRKVVPFEGSTWFGMDPGTVMPAAPVHIENIDPVHCDSFWEREFLVEDTNLWRDLTRRETPVATLFHSTGDNPGRSARYREFLTPQGYGDELRAVFRVGSSTWGVMALHREKDSPGFSRAEADFVVGLCRPIADALRTALPRQSGPAPTDPRAPGLLMFDEQLKLLSLNAEARDWIEELPGARNGDGEIPAQLFSVLSQARAVAQGHESGAARVRVRALSGRWLVLHASCLRRPDGEPSTTAVVIEPAQASEIAPIIVEAYSLSAREQQITQLIAQGHSTNQIAETLVLSAHTVRDHIKTIFDKVSVTSRGELVAKLFAEHYGPALHSAPSSHRSA